MSFCPRCGAATSPGMGFCVACGENLPAIAAPTPGVGVAGMDATPRGPVGKRVRPLFVAAMSLVLSGVYPLWFWWRTSREVDAYAGSKGHGPVRAGVALLVVALGLSIAIGALVAQDIDLTALLQSEGVQVASERFTEGVASHPWTPWQISISAAGALVLYAGLWRVWTAMRDEDLRRNRAAPWDPRIAMAILLGGALIPLLAFVIPNDDVLVLLDLLQLAFMVAAIVLVYQMQARLNETWDAATVRP